MFNCTRINQISSRAWETFSNSFKDDDALANRPTSLGKEKVHKMNKKKEVRTESSPLFLTLPMLTYGKEIKSKNKLAWKVATTAAVRTSRRGKRRLRRRAVWWESSADDLGAGVVGRSWKILSISGGRTTRIKVICFKTRLEGRRAAVGRGML